MGVDSEEIVARLLAQNDRLIEALVRSSPVEIVRALNPPIPPAQAAPDFWRGDADHAEQLDAWADDRVSSEVLLSGRGGWVTPDVAVDSDGGEVD